MKVLVGVELGLSGGIGIRRGFSFGLWRDWPWLDCFGFFGFGPWIFGRCIVNNNSGMKRFVVTLGILCSVLAGCSAMNIDCPAYIEGLHNEADIIARFKGDIESGKVKQIHSK